ncbi:type II toxin-antitoxin system HicA family toxin [Sphingobacterium sp. C459-1T]|uniref:Type II toxin-antitoxin system HicA family toxin n=1 Tax=Sphingobacterium faecale TaxID=2803775 RepID=A0ABS1RB27_9SPHI|nr:type II toxin-antitoxin system HicA family toxin [Sphingobacterium faecale]
MECLVTAPLPHYIYEKGGKTYPVPYHGSKEIGRRHLRQCRFREDYRHQSASAATTHQD